MTTYKLNYHKAPHSDDLKQIENLTCNRCLDKQHNFYNGQALRKHYQTIHFYCQKCDWSFENKTGIKNHMVEVHQEKERKPIVCQICGVSKTCLYDIKKHCYSIHLHCTECDLTLDSKTDTLEHMSIVHQIKVKCDFCDYGTVESGDLKNHMMKQHGGMSSLSTIPQILRCDHCSFITKHQHKFERHLKNKHGQSTPKAEHIHNPKLECYDKTKFIDTNLSVDMAPKFHKRECSTLQCQFCGITKIDNSNLRTHYYAVHNHCLECQTTLESRTATLNHVKTVKHEDTAKDLTEFNCKICGCVKSSQAYLEKHCYAMHNHCFECQVSFNSKSAALNHMKTVHEAKKSTKTSISEEVTSRVKYFTPVTKPTETSNLPKKIVPNETRTGIEEPSDLKKGLLTFTLHKNSRKRKFQCEFCFVIKSCSHDVRKHCFAVHYFCVSCKLQCQSKYDILDHMQHVHELKVNCDFCEFRSSDSSDLKKHISRQHNQKSKAVSREEMIQHSSESNSNTAFIKMEIEEDLCSDE